MKLHYTRFQWVLEALALLLLAATFVFLLVNWNGIPEQIPGHYNAAGEIDRWGKKGELFLLSGISAGIYLLLTLLSFFPKIWNVPVAVTPESQTPVYQITKTMLLAMKAELMVIFGYLTVCMAWARPLSGWFLFLTILAVGATLALALWKIFRVAKTTSKN